MPKQKQTRTEQLVVEAHDFRQSMVARADGFIAQNYPYWHGWVIVDAYMAGHAAGLRAAAKIARESIFVAGVDIAQDIEAALNLAPEKGPPNAT